MRAIVTDFEWRWADGLERKNDDGTDRVPHAPNSVIESIAFVSLVANETTPLTIKLGVIEESTEAQRIQAFVKAWERSKPDVITFGGRRADLPLLLARLAHHLIVAPEMVRSIVFSDRYRSGSYDVYDVLGNYGAQSSGRLEEWSQCFGWPGKGDIDGSKVAGLLNEPGGRRIVDAYCLADAVKATVVWLRFCVVGGKITLDQYDRAARELHRVCLADERVKKTAEAVDLEVWLGEERKAA